MTKTWRVAGINFDHMHMGDNLRMGFEHPRVEIVGIADRDRRRMETAIRRFDVPEDRIYTDEMQLLESAIRTSSSCAPRRPITRRGRSASPPPVPTSSWRSRLRHRSRKPTG